MYFRKIIYFSLFFILNGYVIPLSAQNEQKVDSLELLINYTESDSKKTLLLLELSTELQNNNPNQALAYAKQALDLSIANHQIKTEIIANSKLAEIYWSLTNYKMAMDFASKANYGAIKEDFPVEQALSYRIIGLVYTDLGNYKKASEYFYKSLKIFETIDNKEGIAKALSSIGYVYFDQENYDKALEYYFASLKLAKEEGDLYGIARGLNNVAAVYGNKEEYNKVERYIKEAVEINKKIGNNQWVGINYMNLGLTNQMLNKNDTALLFYKKAIEIFTKLDNTIWQLKCYLNIGGFYLESADYTMSLEYAHRALTEAQNHQMKKIIHDAYRLLRKSYLAKGDTITAYKFTSLQMEAKDSLNIEKNKVQLSKLEWQYEYEKKEQNERIKQQKNNFITIITIIILLFAFALFLLLWARQRVKAQNTELEKQVLEEKLEFKNKEFIMHMMSLMKKNEIIENVGIKLYQVEQEAIKDETKNALHRIALELQKSTDTEIWEEFELRFSQVHSEFYSELLKQFPNLTPNEQKLCAFLHLNMTTKEISELTGQSISTLETARYRLRKKLNITNPKVNLITFLGKI